MNCNCGVKTMSRQPHCWCDDWPPCGPRHWQFPLYSL